MKFIDFAAKGALFALAFIFTLTKQGSAQRTLTVTEDGYTYRTVEGDPLKARIYKLNNGLTVYISVLKDTPRIQTYIVTKAGSKNDPADATGLAHYLEHMLFKGTDKFGTKDWTKEQPLITEIVNLYEQHRNTTDPAERKRIYAKIDSVSQIASEYAIANEYDKLVGSIGASGTNAYTAVEQTVYVNDIPSNQLNKWLTIEAERFRAPVMRLFHTELEAVYEEKNRALDNGGRKAWEELFAGLFQKHSYGTQTTIGTVEHLKNPPLKKVIEYYNTYYVPNNMAICLAGDLDPSETIKLIDQKFGQFPSKEIPQFIPPVESEITSPIVKEVLSPDAENIYIGYRFPGYASADADKLTLIDGLLANGSAGIIDINLNQQQKVLSASAFPVFYKDYSAHVLTGRPREGQKLEEVKDLLLAQLDVIKNGNFSEDLLEAVKNDFRISKIREYESNESRADAFVDAFVKDITWEDYIARLDRISGITKQDIIDFARNNYKNNYVVVYKRTGEDTTIQKVDKPQITPVKVNRDDRSPFVEEILGMPAPDIQPVFVDYKKEISEGSVAGKIPVLYVKNKDNELFSLFYAIKLGTASNNKLALALEYLPYLGTEDMPADVFRQELFKLGTSLSVSSGEDEVYVSLSGLNENFDRSVELLEKLLASPKADAQTLENLKADVLKKRENAKLNKNTILWTALLNYAIYGQKNPFTDRLSKDELMKVTPRELTDVIKTLTSYDHKVLYYGPRDLNTLASSLESRHTIKDNLIKIDTKSPYTEKETSDNKVYVVDYDMQQAEIVLLSKEGRYTAADQPVAALFNEYFGGNMSSVVFQDLRESKALAYSVFASYDQASRLDRSNYALAYIGTQADKLPDAMTGMLDLLNTMPETDILFNSSKQAALEQLRTNRIIKSQLLFSYEAAKKLGLDYDIRKNIYEQIPSLSLSDVRAFHDKNFKDKKYTVLVMGDKNLIDTKVLEKYGKVEYVTLEDIFGY